MKNPIEIPPEWEAMEPARFSGTVMVIGASDRGKSTLVRWLVERICQSRQPVGWLDGDIGQTTLGMPATMNLAVIHEPSNLLPQPRATFFTGATTPCRNMLPVLVGVQRLREKALAEGASAVVIDTTGLVEADVGGGALKKWKIELLRPGIVVALQRDRELEHILPPLRREKRPALYELPPAAAVRFRNPGQRAERRRSLFRDYFKGACCREIQLEDFPVYDLHKACPGRLLSFQDGEGFSLGLGVVSSVTSNRLEVVTPLPELSEVTSIRLGALRVDSSTGKELPQD
jgi:polynucleotide 5'-hydroxyl-kinase GRC3/NOL9